MRLYTTLLLFILCHTINAQNDTKWLVSDIVDSLKVNADVVIRRYDLTYTVLSNQKAIKTVSHVKTLLNKNAEREAVLVVPYDDFRKIKKFSAIVLDEYGNKIDKVKSSEIIDYSGGGQSIDDTRMKIVDLSRSKYPYTIVLNYEVEFNTTFYSPIFAPIHADRISTERASFSLSFPASSPVRFSEFNIHKSIVNGNTYSWKLENIVAHKPKPYTPEKASYLPLVITAPNNFTLGKSSGSLKSWNEFAKWYDELSQGRDKLSTDDKEKIHSLTKDTNDSYEKLRLVYNYMQEHTRYVSIQLGIGGYQTMEAEKVSSLGWGDCKALTNYTLALLKEIDIKAYPALVRSGSNANSIIEDFPSNQFNHVILCVPLKQDTIWLECTSRAMPFNFLGDFTEDRNVLLVKDGGGKLVRTPSYNYSKNIQSRFVKVSIDKNGIGKAISRTEFAGLQFDDILGYVDEPKEKLKRVWYSKLDIPNFTIDDIQFYYKEDEINAVQKLALTLNNYATKSGERYFLKPNLLNRYGSYPKKDDGREEDVVVNFGYTDIDTVVYQFPSNYYFEHLPKDIKIESIFGIYEANFIRSEQGLTYTRKIERYKGVYPKESFNDLVGFLKKVKRSDNIKVVLNSST